MGLEIGGKWAGKPWRREAHHTHIEPFGTSACLWGFEVFYGRMGSLSYGASLCTRLCSGFCLGTLQSSMSGNTSSCAARPRRR